MGKIDVSVIIPAYNEEKYIGKCIKAVQKQKTSSIFEIIVVNNNSTDKTEEVAKKFDVKVINEKRKGVGPARKTGTENAKGEIVIHVDADTILLPNHIEKVVEKFKKNKELVCLGGVFVFYDAPLWKNVSRFFIYPTLLLFAKIVSRGILGPSGNNMAFKKDAYEKTNGFRVDLKFGEDIEIAKELSKFGKVKTDTSLTVGVSVRRFSLDRKFFLYTINFLSHCLRGKPYKNELPEL